MLFNFLVLLTASTAILAADAHASDFRSDLDDGERARVERVVEPTRDFSRPEPFELMQGGAGTVGKRVNRDIFSHPAANLSFEGRQDFMVGNGLFRKDWVSAPSSTVASDGLGPLFNARSCQGCHVKDGRGSMPGLDPLEGKETQALLLRLSMPHRRVTGAADVSGAKPDDEFETSPDPVYGDQFQPFAVAGLPAEGDVAISYREIPVVLNGGETVKLMAPSYEVKNLRYGPMDPATRISPRLAPPMLGLGLLEAIHEDDILANAARPQADGVSGRPNWVHDRRTGEKRLGRFNWKAGQPDVEHQSSAAFSTDMGLSTPLFTSHYGDCTASQALCRSMPHGAQTTQGELEVPSRLMNFVVMYSQNLALPQRRDVDEPRVLAGKKLFYEANCIACHVPKYVTRRDAARPEHRFQLIWPYTDLLLHDMGEGLADGVQEGNAKSREWRTPPLWGIGLTKTVNPDAGWLHDGRARTLLEAILWHGGEAKPAQERVVAMTPDERRDLLQFLESL